MKKILLALAGGICAFSMTFLPVQADDTSEVVFHITYLGDPDTDPIYVIENAENYSTYKSYTPMEASYVISDPSTGETIQSGTLTDGQMTVSGSLTFYNITLENQTVGSTVHIVEESGMVISNGTASSSDGATFTVGSNPQANDFIISVGNTRTLEEVGEPEIQAESSEEAAVEETAEASSTPVVSEQSHDCSSYGSDYYWDSIRGSCMVMASPSPSSSASARQSAVDTPSPAVIIGAAAGIFLLLWAVRMLRKYGSGRKKK